jgi:hypothetical protein
MELEDQVTSFHLSKQLKEHGFLQASVFCWTTEHDLEFLPSSIRNEDVCYSAYIATDLLALLPHCIEKDNNKYGLRIDKGHHRYYVIYDTHSMDNDWCRNEILIENDGYYLCDALAKLLINLLEKKLIEVK